MSSVKKRSTLKCSSGLGGRIRGRLGVKVGVKVFRLHYVGLGLRSGSELGLGRPRLRLEVTATVPP